MLVKWIRCNQWARFRLPRWCLRRASHDTHLEFRPVRVESTTILIFRSPLLDTQHTSDPLRNSRTRVSAGDPEPVRCMLAIFLFQYGSHSAQVQLFNVCVLLSCQVAAGLLESSGDADKKLFVRTTDGPV
jgi:hypothetical protein